MGTQLLSGLNDDAAAVRDVQIQAVAVQQLHAHERGAARCGGLDMSRMAIPQSRNVVHIEAYFIVIGQKCPAYVTAPTPLPTWSARSGSRCSRCLPQPRCPESAAGPCKERATTASWAALDRPVLRRDPAPKLRSARYPPLTQHVDCTGQHRPQTVHGGNLVAADCPVSAVHVNGDDLPVMAGFNLPSDVPLVDLLAEPAVSSFGRVGAMGLGDCAGAGVSESLMRPPSSVLLHLPFYHLAEVFLSVLSPRATMRHTVR